MLRLRADLEEDAGMTLFHHPTTWEQGPLAIVLGVLVIACLILAFRRRA